MDRLTAFVAINHLKLRLQYLSRHPELLEKTDMTPKLQGPASAMARLKHGLEDRSGKLLDRIGAADARSGVAFDKAHKQMDATEKDVAEVEAFLASLEGSNGGPTLRDSSDTSDVSQPEHLTVSGVSVNG
jgi:hypothetical protein